MKDPIPDLNKSCIVYEFNCFCERSYIGQTSRHFKTRIKEHLPAYVLKFIEEEPQIKTTATKNAAKRSSIAEHLINNRDCTRKHKISRFKMINRCINVLISLISNRGGQRTARGPDLARRVKMTGPRAKWNARKGSILQIFYKTLYHIFTKQNCKNLTLKTC